MATEFRELDVRPILKDGGEPFQAIMAAVAALAPGQGLRLLAPFHPQPLFSVMARKGFSHAVSELPGGDVEVRFVPLLSDVMASDNIAEPEAWPDPAIALDLADLEPPQPMVRILAEIERLEAGEVLFAVLAREPVFLFPELTKRGHQWAGNFDREGTAFRMMVRKGAGA